MSSPRLAWRLYAGLLGAAATFAATKLLGAGWQAATGGPPPDVTDPETPRGAALAWTGTTAVAMVISQLLMARYTSRRWQRASAASALRAGRIGWHL